MFEMIVSAFDFPGPASSGRIGCRTSVPPDDGGDVNQLPAAPDQRHALVDLYDRALPDVYGYLVSRCGSAPVAEDLTSETFLAAVDAVRRGTVPELTVAWLIGVARHKLVDHWRRQERDQRLADDLDPPSTDDEWDVHLDALTPHQTLATLGGHHRSALALRYLDGLPVREVAACLGRSEGATEILLVRARAAFRARYEQQSQPVAEEER
jgi:RNA polymerase sigma-70 factor (ECF subfamily)